MCFGVDNVFYRDSCEVKFFIIQYSQKQTLSKALNIENADRGTVGKF